MQSTAKTPPATAHETAPWPPLLVLNMAGEWQAKHVAMVLAGIILAPSTFGLSLILIPIAMRSAASSNAQHVPRYGPQPTMALPIGGGVHNAQVEEVSPSRRRGYDRLLGIFAAHNVVGLPPEQAAPRLKAFFSPMPVGRIEAMLRNPTVMSVLGAPQPDAAPEAPSAATTSDEWWKKAETSEAPAPEPTAPEPGSVEASTGAFWSSEPSTSTDPEPEPAATPDDFMIGASGGAVCGAAGCDRAVTDFDYRCFTCRQRFCMSHRGAGVDCPACSST